MRTKTSRVRNSGIVQILKWQPLAGFGRRPLWKPEIKICKGLLLKNQARLAMTCYCWKCGDAVVFAPGARIGSRDTCSRCDADMHCCKNCEFYDPARHNQCNESQAEWVRDKEAANYCDYFRPTPRRAALTSSSTSNPEYAKKKFDSLFKS